MAIRTRAPPGRFDPSPPPGQGASLARPPRAGGATNTACEAASESDSSLFTMLPILLLTPIEGYQSYHDKIPNGSIAIQNALSWTHQSRFIAEAEADLADSISAKLLTTTKFGPAGNLHCSRIVRETRAMIITSSTAHAYADRMRGRTLWERDPVIPLWLFHENSWERAHGRRGFESMDYPYLLCMTDIFEAEPWLLPVVQTGGPIDDFYRYAGHMEPCDQPLRIKSGKILVRKMAAIHHALRVAKPDATILWYAPHALCWRARCTLLIPSSS